MNIRYPEDKKMKTMLTVPVRVTSSSAIRQPRMVQYKIAYKQTLLCRFQHFIESTGWEERYLRNHRIDKMCLGVIVASMIYFLPLLMSIIQE
jgi:hypothetical protein